VKFLSPEILGKILERTGAVNGDVIFFGADRRKVVNDALGALRMKVGHEKGYAQPGWRPCWVVDFPAYEYDEEHKRWNAAHHPFTSPKDEHVDLMLTDPGKVLAKAYDIALNAWSSVAPLPVSRDHMAVAATGGILYVAGGFAAGRNDRKQPGGPARPHRGRGRQVETSLDTHRRVFAGGRT